jgi:hypothetical protein
MRRWTKERRKRFLATMAAKKWRMGKSEERPAQNGGGKSSVEPVTLSDAWKQGYREGWHDRQQSE